ncbi:MAG: dUTP diphosphatase [Alphaproteobacteria bacterium]|jgi:dUTP pyrophosphatase|nr:dUTP diphosphatase [Alphaproteobacteria bacterium]MBU1562354.1 dUTP diphosphatase [Alphaproteobacteria bacterium]MBU2302674.1 dUTP diphosphatase [Alphaproteobacteria bacterium]MBU2369243.1 dUTP diphosphatase [Alphaproteobacteria bacterium]
MADAVPIGLVWLAHGQGLPLPRQQSAGAAGVDIAAALGPDEVVEIAPGGTAMIPSGFAMALPEGYEAQIRPRSGLAAKFGVTVLNAPGTVDADYRGEVKVMLINHGQAPFAVRRGERIAQMVVAPVSQVFFTQLETLDETERGDRGHGSTGR